MIDRNILQNIDWILIGLLLLNSVIGVAFIYSSSHYLQGNYYLKQILWILLGSVVLFLLLSIDYKMLISFSTYFYILALALLGGVLLFGRLVAGARSWIKLPFIQFQPSELMKVALILILAHVFAKFARDYLSWKKGLLVGALTVVPVLIVALQPDLGTAFSYIPICLSALILAGINKKIFIYMLVIVLVLSVFVWSFGLRDYQKKRLTTLFSPEKDPLGSGYHVLQSKIAIGSGGFLGKGYMKGSQSQLRFLPARHTDFIFSVIGEEFGFVGVTVVLFAYFLFLFRLFQSIGQSRDRAGIYIIFMVAVMVAYQFFINVMMIIGLFPISGTPLPLLSYGGSSLFTTYLGVSLVLNVKMRRFVNV